MSESLMHISEEITVFACPSLCQQQWHSHDITVTMNNGYRVISNNDKLSGVHYSSFLLKKKEKKKHGEGAKGIKITV